MQYFFGDLASGGGLTRAGKIKALAVLSDRRLPGFDQVPTMAEAGYPGMEIPIWIGMFAPKGTPAEHGRTHQPRHRHGSRQTGVYRRPGTGSRECPQHDARNFAKYVTDQYQMWGKLAKEINLEQE